LISTNQLKIELQHSFQKEEQIGQKRRRRSWTARERSRDRDIFFAAMLRFFEEGKNSLLVSLSLATSPITIIIIIENLGSGERERANNPKFFDYSVQLLVNHGEKKEEENFC
jgi:hypothetical protein